MQGSPPAGHVQQRRRRLLVGRLSNRETAGRLHLSPRTVERHVSSLLGKTGLPNRIALSEFAAEVERG